jgi:hypothetical protein
MKPLYWMTLLLAFPQIALSQSNQLYLEVDAPALDSLPIRIVDIRDLRVSKQSVGSMKLDGGVFKTTIQAEPDASTLIQTFLSEYSPQQANGPEIIFYIEQLQIDDRRNDTDKALLIHYSFRFVNERDSQRRLIQRFEATDTLRGEKAHYDVPLRMAQTILQSVRTIPAFDPDNETLPMVEDVGPVTVTDKPSHSFTFGVSPFFAARSKGFIIQSSIRYNDRFNYIGFTFLEITNPAFRNFYEASINYSRFGPIIQQRAGDGLLFEFYPHVIFGTETISGYVKETNVIVGLYMSPKLLIMNDNLPFYLGFGAFGQFLTSGVYPNDFGALFEVGIKL